MLFFVVFYKCYFLQDNVVGLECCNADTNNIIVWIKKLFKHHQYQIIIGSWQSNSNTFEKKNRYHPFSAVSSARNDCVRDKRHGTNQTHITARGSQYMQRPNENRTQ